MRSLSALILLIGVVASEPFFPAGQEYQFDYRGNILSGFPELGPQYAGLSLDGKIILQAKTSEEFKIALKNVKFSAYNQKLDGPDSQSWKTLETPETAEVPSEFRQTLETPVEFTMRNGEISNIRISQDEPQWSVNFKKALISLVKVQTPNRDLNSQVENTVRSQAQNGLPTVWRVMEEGVDGLFENTYHFTELPEALEREISREVLRPDLCQGKRLYQLVKTRDINNAVERAIFQTNQPGTYECPLGNCENMWSRSSMVRYVGCGASPDTMQLHAIVNEAEVRQSLLAYNTEDVVTGVRQILKLVQTQSSLTNLPEISNPRKVNDLKYEYPQGLESSRQERPTSYREQKEQLQGLEKDLRNSQVSVKISDAVLIKLSPDTLKQRIVDELKKISEDIEESENFGDKQIPLRVLSLSKIMSLLSKEQIEDVYRTVKSNLGLSQEKQETVRQLFLEITVVTGTNPAIMFLKQIIESEEISPLRAGIAISTLPHYIKTPNVKILDQIFELIKSPAITKNLLLRSNAQQAFATILNKACIDEGRVYRFPVFVFGDFCNEKTSELNTKYIPFLADQLKSSSNERERRAILLNLGTIGHKAVLPIIIPYIEGSVSGSTSSQQRVALYSLNLVTMKYREVLLPIYHSLVLNRNGDRSVRLAAFSMLLNMEPELSHFQSIATSTWFEKDNEFHKFVYSALKSLSEMKTEERPTYGTLQLLNRKAQIVLPLAKPLPLGFSSSLNKFTSEWLKDLSVGYQYLRSTSKFSSSHTMYVKLEYFLQQLKFTPMEFCMETDGLSTIFQKIKDSFTTDSFNQNENIHPEWREIVSSIDLKLKEDTPFSHGIWMRIFDDVTLVSGMDTPTVENVIRKAKEIVSAPEQLKEKLCGKSQFNFLKFNNIDPSEILIPSDMGFPIIVEAHMPGVLVAQGEINVDCSSIIPAVTLDIMKKGSTNNIGYVGTVSPFTNEIIAVGLDEHYTFNLPTKTSIKVEMGKLQVKMEQSKYAQPSGRNVDVMKYSIKPFSVIKPQLPLDITPISLHQNVKYIESGDTKKKMSKNVGGFLGLDMKFEMETESEIRDFRSLMDHTKLYKYSPLNTLLFGWTSTAMRADGTPSARYHSMTLSFNPSNSQTKEVDIEVDLHLARQKQQQQPELVKIISSSRQGLQMESSSLDSSKYEHSQLQECLSKMNVKQGYALNMILNVEVKGTEPKTLSYSVTSGQGSNGVDEKWSLQVLNKENPNSNMNLCIDGKMTLPLYSIWEIEQLQAENIQFSFINNIGFGKTCQEQTIRIRGNGQVSSAQKEFSKKTMEGKECKKITHEIEKLNKEIKKSQRSSSSQEKIKQMQEALSHKSVKEQYYCQKQREQASSLDKVEFTVQYSPMSQDYLMKAQTLDAVVKAYLLPYVTNINAPGPQNEIKLKLQLNPGHKVFSLELATEKQTVEYNNVRIPEALRELLPIAVVLKPKEQMYKAVTGSYLYPKCRISESTISTFDNKTYAYELDDCEHVVAADCSQRMSHSVLAKKVEGKLHVRVFAEKSQLVIKPSSNYDEDHKEFEIELDGKRILISKNEKKILENQDRTSTYKIQRSSDDVIEIAAQAIKIVYDGKAIEVNKADLIADGKQCGLCGTANGDRNGDLQSSQACVSNSYESAALSYRVQQSCSQLSQEKQSKKDQVLSNCVRKTQEKSPIQQILETKKEKCSQLKHSIVRQGNQLCISQTPVVQCGSHCTAQDIATKKVGFACLPANRKMVNILNEEKVKQGNLLPELKSMDSAFTAELEVPTSCSDIQL